MVFDKPLYMNLSVYTSTALFLRDALFFFGFTSTVSICSSSGSGVFVNGLGSGSGSGSGSITGGFNIAS